MTRDQIIDEVRELERDLSVFKAARDLVNGRVQELAENPVRQAMVKDWPAFTVVDSGLILAIVRLEGLLEDYRNLLAANQSDNIIPLERRPK